MHCTSNTNSAIHQWGTYATCLQLQGDTCEAIDGGCYPSLSSDTVTLGVNAEAGVAYDYRGPDAPVIGRQVGNRFLFIADTLDGGLPEPVCGCQARVVETFYGELLPTTAPGCPDDAGAFGCGMLPDASFSVESWLDIDASIDPTVTLPGFQGVSVDSLTVQPGSIIPDAGCPCLPCTVVYNLSGSLAN